MHLSSVFMTVVCFTGRFELQVYTLTGKGVWDGIGDLGKLKIKR